MGPRRSGRIELENIPGNAAKVQCPFWSAKPRVNCLKHWPHFRINVPLAHCNCPVPQQLMQRQQRSARASTKL